MFLSIQDGVFCKQVWNIPNPFEAIVGDLMQTKDLALEESCCSQINHN